MMFIKPFAEMHAYDVNEALLDQRLGQLSRTNIATYLKFNFMIFSFVLSQIKQRHCFYEHNTRWFAN